MSNANVWLSYSRVEFSLVACISDLREVFIVISFSHNSQWCESRSDSLSFSTEVKDTHHQSQRHLSITETKCQLSFFLDSVIILDDSRTTS